MKISVTGTRGIPGIQGGVETHCLNLYPKLAEAGHEVTVYRRRPYTSATAEMSTYRGIRLKDLYAPRSKSCEAIVHTFMAIMSARRYRPDILHIHAIGPAILTPLAKLMGMKVVMTHHGHDYERSKWGRIARAVLRTGERLGCRYADGIIAVSENIASSIVSLYGRTDVATIVNGVELPPHSTATDYIKSLGLENRRYVVAIGRFVKEKEFHTLLEAWELMDKPDDMQLVIAGDADHDDDYSRRLKQQAQALGVILTGFITGSRLNQLMSHAALFVLPSSHEGLPIALLEAMSHGLDVAVSDIKACRLPELDDYDYFECGNKTSLAQLIGRKIKEHNTPRVFNMKRYDWNEIARLTDSVYRKVIAGKRQQ